MKNILIVLILTASAAALFLGILSSHTLFTHELLSQNAYSDKLHPADHILYALLVIQLVFTLSLVAWIERLKRHAIKRNESTEQGVPPLRRTKCAEGER